MSKHVATRVTTTYTCDGCGLLVSHHGGSWVTVNMPRHGRKRRGTLDYCPECSEELEAWLVNLKERKAV